MGYSKLVERLELVVGSDLQYIRMNGTIVGVCAGCLIFIVQGVAACKAAGSEPHSR
jgi:uncharacterized membrane-anchored protein YjiN (DUF445 family)